MFENLYDKRWEENSHNMKAKSIKALEGWVAIAKKVKAYVESILGCYCASSKNYQRSNSQGWGQEEKFDDSRAYTYDLLKRVEVAQDQIKIAS